jgi:hypothetical protein
MGGLREMFSRLVGLSGLALAGLVSCGSETAVPVEASGGACGADGSGNADGDCLTDGEELALGTDPTLADSDGDGDDDCKELDCGSDPIDGSERCYACGWKRNDPGNLVSTGAAVGDVIENLHLFDQCGDEVELWDFAQAYHILFMTAAW